MEARLESVIYWRNKYFINLIWKFKIFWIVLWTGETVFIWMVPDTNPEVEYPECSLIFLSVCWQIQKRYFIMNYDCFFSLTSINYITINIIML
jgi:hypothetical protein